jgi:hypothetical protein
MFRGRGPFVLFLYVCVFVCVVDDRWELALHSRRCKAAARPPFLFFFFSQMFSLFTLFRGWSRSSKMYRKGTFSCSGQTPQWPHLPFYTGARPSSSPANYQPP